LTGADRPRLNPVLVLRNRPGEEFIADFVSEKDESVHAAFMSVLLPNPYYFSEVSELCRCLEFFWFTGKFALYACDMIREYGIVRHRVNLDFGNKDEELCLSSFRKSKAKIAADPAAILDAYTCARWKAPAYVAPLMREIACERISVFLARSADDTDKADAQARQKFASRIACRWFQGFPQFVRNTLYPRIENELLGLEQVAWMPATKEERFKIPYLHEKKSDTAEANCDF
jgi:phage gp36-like protein